MNEKEEMTEMKDVFLEVLHGSTTKIFLLPHVATKKEMKTKDFQKNFLFPVRKIECYQCEDDIIRSNLS